MKAIIASLENLSLAELNAKHELYKNMSNESYDSAIRIMQTLAPNLAQLYSEMSFNRMKIAEKFAAKIFKNAPEYFEHASFVLQCTHAADQAKQIAKECIFAKDRLYG